MCVMRPQCVRVCVCELCMSTLHTAKEVLQHCNTLQDKW